MIPDIVAPGGSALVQRFSEQLYRLALLITGDSAAALQLVEQSFSGITTDDQEAVWPLLRGLWPEQRRPRRWRWQPGPKQVERAQLGDDDAAALVGLIARRDPASRMIIGLHYLRGLSADEIAALLTGHPAPAPVDVIARFRMEAARLLRLVPSEVNDRALERIDRWLDGRSAADEERDVRSATLMDGQQRLVRDGLIETRALLARALPGLFAVSAPADLEARLLRQQHTSATAQATRPVRALIALTVGVLVLAAAIVLVPMFMSAPEEPSQTALISADDLIDSAIHRFEQVPVQAGVLHERQRIAHAGRVPLVVERWYDFGAPQRLNMTIAEEGEEVPLLEISTDGRSQIQYRLHESRSNGEEFALDARASEAEIQEILPLLRGAFASAALFWAYGEPNSGPASFLGQARAAGAVFLGQTTYLDRPAYLVSYETSYPPMVTRPANRLEPRPSRVVLTIDAQTYALLDAAVLDLRDVEGEAVRPIQTLEIDLLPDVPDHRFALARVEGSEERSGWQSVQYPWLPEEWFVTLDEARRYASQTLLVPRYLPDSDMRGLVLSFSSRDGSQGTALLYEGEFQYVQLMIDRSGSGRATIDLDEVNRIGMFEYVLLDADAASAHVATGAVLRQADQPEWDITLHLSDPYATEEQRRATLEEIIASLTPLTAENVAEFERSFRVPARQERG